MIKETAKKEIKIQSTDSNVNTNIKETPNITAKVKETPNITATTTNSRAPIAKLKIVEITKEEVEKSTTTTTNIKAPLVKPKIVEITKEEAEKSKEQTNASANGKNDNISNISYYIN